MERHIDENYRNRNYIRKKYPERNKDTQKSEEGDQKIEHTEIKL